jgi:hypothetical protein
MIKRKITTGNKHKELTPGEIISTLCKVHYNVQYQLKRKVQLLF